MSNDPAEPPQQEFDARLRRAQERQAEREGTGGRRAQRSGIGFAFRIGTELVAGIALGVGIGLGLDWWLDTRPWLMIVFFFLGAAAGMLNVYRTVTGLGHAVGYGMRDKDGTSDDER